MIRIAKFNECSFLKTYLLNYSRREYIMILNRDYDTMSLENIVKSDLTKHEGVD